MRAPVFAFAALLLSGPAATAQASTLQLAIVIDTTLHQSSSSRPPSAKLLAELEAFEAAILAEHPDAEFAFVECRRPYARGPAEPVIASGFSPNARGIADRVAQIISPSEALFGCPASVDVVQTAIDELKWRDAAKKRILVLGSDGVLSPGKTTAEDVVHIAERKQIVVSALELIDASLFWLVRGRDAQSSIHRDVLDFLENPLRPLGRVPVRPRHSVELSGGAHALIVSDRMNKSLELRHPLFLELQKGEDYGLERLRADLERAFGPRVRGRDALDDLAEGLRRPSEIKPEELPEDLAGVDLEPLLDAVWDFVDARRVLGELVAQRDEQSVERGRIGKELARGVLGPRRLPPSRR